MTAAAAPPGVTGQASLRARAARHAKLRYIGIPMFCLGAVGIVTALGLWLGGDGKGGWVLLYIGATGLSLATFGTHNDTAIAYMVRAEGLPEALKTELKQEMDRDRAGTQELAPTPGIASAMTLIAIALHVLAGSRFLTLL